MITEMHMNTELWEFRLTNSIWVGRGLLDQGGAEEAEEVAAAGEAEARDEVGLGDGGAADDATALEHGDGAAGAGEVGGGAAVWPPPITTASHRFPLGRSCCCGVDDGASVEKQRR